MPNSEKRPAVLVLSDPRTLRRVLVLLACLAFALQGSYIVGPTSSSITPSTGNPAFVQAVEAHTAGTPTNLSVSFGSLPVVAHVVIVGVVSGPGPADHTAQVTDNQANGYSRLLIQPNIAGTVQRADLWCAPVATSTGTFTATVTFSTNTLMGIFALEYSGTTCNMDKAAAANTNTSPYNCGSITTVNAKDLVLAFLGTNPALAAVTYTAPTGFTIRKSQTDPTLGLTGSIADKIVSGTATFTPTYTATQNVVTSPCITSALISTP